ncbi:putative electron transfer flavoprotein subunit [Geranomyces michiganensis]|nr:putative electron transfer flavoprotein subunit [Geranomyces michiganensis]
MDSAASFFPIADPTFGALNEIIYSRSSYEFWPTGSDNISQLPFFDSLPRFPTASEALPQSADWPLGMPPFCEDTAPGTLTEKLGIDFKQQYLAQEQFLYDPLAASAAAAAAAVDMAESLVRSAFAPSAEAGVSLFAPVSPPPSGRGSTSDDGVTEPRPLTKAERKKLRENTRNLTCHNCGTHKTPLWRRTADKRHSVCNACGLYYKQYQCNRPISVRAPRESVMNGGGPLRSTVTRPARAALNTSAVSIAPAVCNPAVVGSPSAVSSSTASALSTGNVADATIKSELMPAAMPPATVKSELESVATPLAAVKAKTQPAGARVKRRAAAATTGAAATTTSLHAGNVAHFRSRVAQLPIADAQRLLETLECQLAFVRDYCAASGTAVC